MSVRITAAGAVAISFLTCLTAPVSACDERYIKKCERASASAATAGEEPTAPAARRKSAGRVHVVVSRRAKHIRFAKRMRGPEFATRGRMVSVESRMTTAQPESALARRFRGFIDPTPIAQNAFEALRKPHVVALNLEAPTSLLPIEAAPVAAEAPAEPQAPAVVASATKQDRVTPKPAMELASAESKRVVLPDPPAAKPAVVETANAVPANAAPAPQAFFTAAAQQPDEPKRSGFPVHQLVIALCGALGVAGALRFVVGA